MDMWGVLKLLAELDYKYMVMPDHVPHLSGTSVAAPAPAGGDHPQHAATKSNDAIAFAYCFGYIRAQLQILKEQYPDSIEL
jgi:mannonate dehydratase